MVAIINTMVAIINTMVAIINTMVAIVSTMVMIINTMVMYWAGFIQYKHSSLLSFFGRMSFSRRALPHFHQTQNKCFDILATSRADWRWAS